MVEEADDLIDGADLYDYDLYDDNKEFKKLQPEDSIYGDWSFESSVLWCCYSGYKDEADDWRYNSFDGYQCNLLD